MHGAPRSASALILSRMARFALTSALVTAVEVIDEGALSGASRAGRTVIDQPVGQFGRVYGPHLGRGHWAKTAGSLAMMPPSPVRMGVT